MTRPSRREVVVGRRADLGLPGPVGHLEHRARAGWTRSRRARRAGSRVSRSRAMHVAQAAAEHARRLARRASPARARRRRSRGSRAARRSRSSSPPLACGLAPIRRSPARRQRGQLRAQRAVGVEQLLRPVGAHPLLELRRGARGCRRTLASGTWCERNVPSAGSPSTTFGPGPALRRAQHDHRPARALGVAVLARGRAGSRRSRRATSSSAAAMQLVHRRRVVALDEIAARSRSPRAARAAPRRGSGPAPSGWRSCSR